MTDTRQGFVQVYTGDGKGKTTAALGLIARAVGQNLRPLFLQFMKSDANLGEIRTLEKLGVPVVQCGLDHWVRLGKTTDDDARAAGAGVARARELLTSGDYDLVVLDELATAMHFGLVDAAAALALVAARPPQVELVITGRRAGEELVAAADLVTEMRPLKHYFDAGVRARRGIEY